MTDKKEDKQIADKKDDKKDDKKEDEKKEPNDKFYGKSAYRIGLSNFASNYRVEKELDLTGESIQGKGLQVNSITDEITEEASKVIQPLRRRTGHLVLPAGPVLQIAAPAVAYRCSGRQRARRLSALHSGKIGGAVEAG